MDPDPGGYLGVDPDLGGYLGVDPDLGGYLDVDPDPGGYLGVDPDPGVCPCWLLLLLLLPFAFKAVAGPKAWRVACCLASLWLLCP